jgi:hypothetical protein
MSAVGGGGSWGGRLANRAAASSNRISSVADPGLS